MNPWTTEKDLLAEFRLLEEVRDGLKREDKVIVHFLDGEIGFNFFGELRKLLGRGNERVRLVGSYHQPGPLLETVLLHKDRTRDLDLVLTVGTSQLPFFRFLPEKNVRFVPHGVDTAYFRPSGLSVPGDPLYCLTVGFWLRDFEALEKVVRASQGNIVYRVVSNQESTERFRGLPNVEIYSGIEDSDLLRLFQQSNIGLMPLLDSTANNSLLEMMSCGLPIITTDVGSVKDYLPEGTGILLERNDPRDILQAIHSLDAETRQTLGGAARRRALELDWKNIALQMRTHYEMLY
jgi:glycosyltransferase involved in cell wall biosynthesis